MSAHQSVCMLLHRSLEHDARVRREAAALISAGYRVSIFELAPTGDLPGFDRHRIRGKPAAGRRGVRLRLGQLAFMLTFVGAIVRARPGIVHAHDVAMLLPGLIGARLTGAILVYDSHELASGVAYRHGLFARVVNALERLGIRRAARVVTVSDSIADRLHHRYALARPPVVVRNVCALRRPSPTDPVGGLRKQIGIEGQPLVLHQGSAAPERGCENLIRSMVEVPEAHLAFLGTAEPGFEAALTALARQAGVAERVHFVPSVPLDELLAHTREADLGVTLFEPTCENYRLTIPNKLFEYVAAGVPVLGSSQPEVERLILDHAIGWTVDPASVAAVAAGLRQGLAEGRDPALRARVRAADQAFSWDEEQRRLVGAYRTLET